jgi:hypothetical protein
VRVGARGASGAFARGGSIVTRFGLVRGALRAAGGGFVALAAAPGEFGSCGNGRGGAMAAVRARDAAARAC